MPWTSETPWASRGAKPKVNQTLLKLIEIEEEPLKDKNLLDVGCGSGALTFALAPRVKHIVGIDISSEKIKKARQIVFAHGFENAKFYVKDAYTADYHRFGQIDMVVSHLFMANEVIARSAEVLREGSCFVFACLHSDNLKELGVRSRFSYTKEEMRKFLEKNGFKIEYLQQEEERIRFKSPEEAISSISESTHKKWQKRNRWQGFVSYLEEGGRTLTKSILVGKARK